MWGLTASKDLVLIQIRAGRVDGMAIVYRRCGSTVVAMK